MSMSQKISINNRNDILFLLIVALIFITGIANAENVGTPIRTLIYPKPEVVNDDRGLFPLLVLQLALSKVDSSYTLTPSGSIMDQERALRQLETTNGGIDIVWTMTSIERESRLLPIRIPIDKGLLGWRLALVSSKNGQIFKYVKSTDDFKKFVGCQGHDWPDTMILKGNGIQVLTDPSYPKLFKLIESGKADYFPRSSLEVWNELEINKVNGILLDPYLVIRYPTAMYFFVNKAKVGLARLITTGFEMAINDGSFGRLFQSEYGEKLRTAKFSSRRVINLENPLLPKATPTDRKELWFSP